MADHTDCHLPTDEEFAEWLIPPTDPCPVCYQTFNISNNFPVQLACNHYVCNRCLTQWTLVEGNNSCPMDRCRLYWSEEFEEPEDDDEEDRERRRALGTGEAWPIVLADDVQEQIAFTKRLWHILLVQFWGFPADHATPEAPAFLRVIITCGLCFWPTAAPYDHIMRAENDENILSAFPLIRLARTMVMAIISCGYDNLLTDDAAEIMMEGQLEL